MYVIMEKKKRYWPIQFNDLFVICKSKHFEGEIFRIIKIIMKQDTKIREIGWNGDTCLVINLSKTIFIADGNPCKLFRHFDI